MVTLKPLLTALLKTSLRRFFNAGSKSRDAGAMLLAVVLFSQGSRFVGLCSEAAFRLSLGETTLARTILQLLFFVWVLVPLLLRGGGLDLDSVVRLRRLPFTPVQVFLLGTAELVTMPLPWLLLAANGFAFMLAANTPAGVVAYVGFACFSISCFAAMLAVAHLLLLANMSKTGRLAAFATVLVVLCAAVWAPDLGRTLAPGDAWVEMALAPNPASLARVSAICLGLVLLAGLSFALLLHEMRRDTGETHALKQGKGWFPLPPGPYGHMLRVGFLRRFVGMETGLALVISCGACLQLGWGTQLEPPAYWFGLGLVGVCSAPHWHNLFGVDGNGVLRYLLWPCAGWKILALSHLCCLVVMVLPMLPLLLIASLRLGFTAGVGGICFVLAQMLLLALIGLRPSLLDPVPSSSSLNNRGIQGGLALLALTLAAVLGLVVCAISYWRESAGTCAVAMAVLALIAGIVYAWVLRRSGRLFENSGTLFQARLGSLAD